MSFSIRDKYQAKVLSNEDPEKRGRLRLTCTAITEKGLMLPAAGDAEIDNPNDRGWIPPVFPYAGVDHGFFFVPSPGDTVLLEMVVTRPDDRSRAVSLLRNPDYRWVGCLYDTTDDVPNEFKSKYAKRMGLKSPGGLVLVFDDSTQHINLIAPKVHLGSDHSSEPFVLGNVFLTMMTTLLDAIMAHTHATAVGPSSPLIDVMAFEAIKAIPIMNRAIVSDVAFSEKSNP